MLSSAPSTHFGQVILVRGSQARVGLLAKGTLNYVEARATVGRFLSLRCAGSAIIGIVTEVSCENLPAGDRFAAVASVDLLGEILGGASPRFQRGVSIYPTIGDAADLITTEELRTI